jgi:hypothetical protein
MKTQKWISPFDKCDICENKIKGVAEFFVDGKIKNATCWALMCPTCFRDHGVGIGYGVGQKYNGTNGELLEGGNKNKEK